MMLLELSSDANARNEKQDMPLHVACSRGDSAIVQALLAAGSAVDALNAVLTAAGVSHATALALAANEGRLEAVKVLVEAGMDLEAREFFGYTALERAVIKEHADIVKT
ncbi:hypothetical protein WJX72_008952 [[Myrmecia] bisecta]|uniref:Ankyrin repeat protein n=1 Tax=[Myrmecia] bisecta TaxID=41462 RepID=A0AAW1PI87_9CHLO